jgi:alpha-tubulin suppressor-like RCC1 family protein
MRRSQSSTARSRYILTTGFLLVGLPLTSLQAQGFISTWGNTSGPHSNTPLGSFIQLEAAWSHNVALSADGAIVSWGYDEDGQVSNTPSDEGCIWVAAGDRHSLALRADGSIVAWGIQNGHHLYDFGQVSNVPGGSGHTQVEAGVIYSLALGHDGSIVSWGGGEVAWNTPTETGFTQIAGGAWHAHALRGNGSLASWGEDNHGQVHTTPLGSDFTQVAAGRYHSIALRADGSVVSWGYDQDGQVANTPVGTGFTQVAAGAYHSLALRADGSIVSWGYDQDGQVSSTPGDKIFTHVAAGSGLSLALHSGNTGDAFCLGDGTGGVCPCSSYGFSGEGCANSEGGGAMLIGSGNAQIEQDTFQFEVVGVPDNRPGLILRGASFLNGSIGSAVADGLLCIGGNTARSQVQFASGGSATFSDFQGSPFGVSSYGTGVSTNYQFWYRDSQNSCSGSGFNFSNAWTVTWL